MRSQAPIGRALQEALQEALAAERPRGQLSVGTQELATMRVERIVARVEDERDRRTRERRAQKGPIDLLHRHLDVEAARLLRGITRDEAPPPRQLSRRLQQKAVAIELEA